MATNDRKHLMTAAEAFDSIGPAYETAFAHSEDQTESIKWVLDQLELKQCKPAKILDIGCGTGTPVCSSFADAGHNVLGVDVSSVMVEHARQHVLNARFERLNVLQWDPTSLNHGDGPYYDVVTVYHSLIAELSQQQIRDQIRRIYDWIKPGGAFVFATVALDVDQITTSFLGRPLIGSSLDCDGALYALKEAGFDVVYHHESMFSPRAVEAGICDVQDSPDEPHVFCYAVKR